MDINGRPNHIEDYLITVRQGSWFGWSDAKNKVYANLVVHDGGSKPTETDCTNGLKSLQDSWDLEYDSYKSKKEEPILKKTGLLALAEENWVSQTGDSDEQKRRAYLKKEKIHDKLLIVLIVSCEADQLHKRNWMR